MASQETTCSLFLRILLPMALMELHLIQPNKIGVATLEDRWEDQWDHPWDNLGDKWVEDTADKWEEATVDK